MHRRARILGTTSQHLGKTALPFDLSCATDNNQTCLYHLPWIRVPRGLTHFTTILCLKHIHLHKCFQHEIPSHLQRRHTILNTPINIPPAAADVTQGTLSKLWEALLPFSCFLYSHHQVRSGSQYWDAAVTLDLLNLLPSPLAAIPSARVRIPLN